MTMRMTLCMDCERFDRADMTKNSCTAFPDGIPKVIFLGEYDHTKPFPGDHGLRFVARDEE